MIIFVVPKHPRPSAFRMLFKIGHDECKNTRSGSPEPVHEGTIKNEMGAPEGTNLVK